MILDLVTFISRIVGGVLLLLPTNLGTPAVITAPIAQGSPFFRAARASFCVPPSGASINTTSASQPAFKKPLLRP